jgi:hypothetical protein
MYVFTVDHYHKICTSSTQKLVLTKRHLEYGMFFVLSIIISQNYVFIYVLCTWKPKPIAININRKKSDATLNYITTTTTT